VGLKWSALAVVVAVLAAACTSGSAPETEADITASTIPRTGTPPAETTAPIQPGTAPVSTSTTQPPTRPTGEWPTLRLEDCPEDECARPWEGAWAADRSAAVQRIAQAGWGVDDDGVLRGPGGLELDLAQCPQSWDKKGGATEGEVALVATGPFEMFGDREPGNLVDGFTAAIDEANRGGGVDGRMVRLIVQDQGYLVGSRLIPLEDEVLADDPFAVIPYGIGRIRETLDFLPRRCVPLSMPFAGDAHSSTTPWHIPGGRGYAVEARLLVEYAEQLIQDGELTVGVLLMDNDFGESFVPGLEAALAGIAHRQPSLQLVRHDPAAPFSLEPEVRELLLAEPDLLLVLTAANPCNLAVRAVQSLVEQGLQRPPALALSSPCRDVVESDHTIDGWLTVAPLVEPDAVGGDGPFAHHLRSMLEGAHLDATAELNLEGYLRGWLHIELLRIAAELPGGLSRPNYLLAAWSADLRPPLVPPGASFTLGGPADLDPYNGAVLQRFDSVKGGWVDITFLSAGKTNAE